jgi:hypothetical protein
MTASAALARLARLSDLPWPIARSVTCLGRSLGDLAWPLARSVTCLGSGADAIQALVLCW